jgi:inhibitor of KinA
MQIRVLPLGDRAITFELGDKIDPVISQKIRAVNFLLSDAIIGGKLDGVIETVATFRSLTVHYNPLVLYPIDVEQKILPFFEHSINLNARPKIWDIPCCYEGEYAPDIEDVAKRCSLSVQDVIQRHSSPVYDAYMLGFLPGFAFLGTLDEDLVLPRRDEPRTAVPKASVAIADQLTAIYPSESPGGWHLIGRTNLELFDVKRDEPAMVKAGDQVRFIPVSMAEFENGGCGS